MQLLENLAIVRRHYTKKEEDENSKKKKEIFFIVPRFGPTLKVKKKKEKCLNQC
jgi:hypothetical protein